MTNTPKRQQRLIKEQQELLAYSQGDRLFDDLTIDCLENMGANIDEQHAEKFLKDFSRRQEFLFSELLPVIIGRRVRDQKKDTHVWVNTYLHLERKKEDPILLEKGQEQMRLMGYTVGKYLQHDLLSHALQNIAPLTEHFLRGLCKGALSERSGNNVKVLMDQNLLGEKDVALFLEGFIHHSHRTRKDTLAGRDNVLHRGVLEVLFLQGDENTRRTIVLGCAHVSCRVRDERSVGIARRFFGNHCSIEYALQAIEEIEADNDLPFSWGSSQKNRRLAHFDQVVGLLKTLCHTPSEPLLTRMQNLKTDFLASDLFGRNIAGEFRDFLAEYEKTVLMTNMPSKDAKTTKRM